MDDITYYTDEIPKMLNMTINPGYAGDLDEDNPKIDKRQVLI